MVKKEEIYFLTQLGSALEETSRKLEDFYEQRDIEWFTKAKVLMIKIQRRIDEIVK